MGYMKKIWFAVCLLAGFLNTEAQEETLSPLGFNPKLYYTECPHHAKSKPYKYLVEKKNIIVSTETISLPFIDDFSTDRTRSYKWLENHITDTFYNVIGTCLTVEGVETFPVKIMYDTSWTYSYDIVNHRVDSAAKPSLTFTFFGPAVTGCFEQQPQTNYYWPEYYRYEFDSLGKKTDSTLVPADETLRFAPVVYFAQGQPGTLWTDNYAFVNNTYPIEPPTIGVATFDGLNEYGLPYNVNANSYGSADMLTSKPIDFSSYRDSSNVYISFFYEAMGLGDCPEKNDSLILEFKDVGYIWRTVWADTGYSSEAYVPQSFKQVFVKVPNNTLQTSFYHPTFQFRFRNKASLYGNNDHWHIDYVRFDQNRQSDTIIRDIAFMYDFPTILKEYTHMPADQFTGAADLRDSILLPVRNLDPDALNNPPATNFVKGAVETYPTPLVVGNDVLETFNAGPFNFIGVNPATEYNIPVPPGAPVDSLVIVSRAFVQPNDSRAQNDTLYHTQNFNYLMAYDDGTAEKAYGISGVGLKKLGYEFELNQPDTLAGFQIMFAQVEENVNDLIFNFALWDSLRMNDFTFVDNPVLTIENKKPLYVDSTNGFATYVLDTPVILSGKFYFGWAQTDARKLQIGYDLNSTLGRKHMYIYTNATWKPSTIFPIGSPMIRMIFDTDFWGTGSFPLAVKNLNKETGQEQLSVFPNPTTGIIQFNTPNGEFSGEITVQNLMGQEVRKALVTNRSIDISSFNDGLYLLTARNLLTGHLSYHKILKTSGR